jgi:alpha-beta hydrolase superfamily lysophospholipase
MHLKRTNINGIIAEFLEPKHPSNKVAFVCDGLPSLPSKKPLVKWLSKLGFWTFHIRYRGAWESEGRFLDHDPSEDVLEVLTNLSKGFTSIWDNAEFQITPEKVVVVGSSLGGTTALMASLDKRVDKVVALAPVIDWTDETGEEPMDWLEQLLIKGWPEAFRFDHEDWMRLTRGEFFQPQAVQDKFDAAKMFVIHAQDDTVVSIGPTRDFVEKIGCKHKFLRRGDHLSSSRVLKWPLSRSVRTFLLS